MDRTKKVVIIGAGAIGLSAAYYLAREGYDITILESSNRQEGCSYGNAGMIVPSHFIPLAAPGVIKKGIKWHFNPESPFHIKASADPDLLKWLWKFYRSSTQKHVLDSTSLLAYLNLTSKKLFGELNGLLDFGFESRGILMVSNTKRGLEEEVEIAHMAERNGVIAEVLSAREISELQPGTRFDIKGGVFFKQDASINPALFMTRMSMWLQENGVRIVYGTSADGFISEGGKLRAVISGREDFPADEFVIASGAWSGEIAGKLGLKLPVIAGKGYSITLANPAKQLTIPSILTEGKVAITPIDNILRFAGTMELTGLDQEIQKRRIKGMIKSIRAYMPDYKDVDLESLKVWAGLRPVSADGLPYIGRFGRYSNLIAATGHSMMGISLAPVTGRLIEEIVSRKESAIDLARLSPDR